MGKRKPQGEPVNPWKPRVEALMSRYHLTQAQLAKRLGVKQATVSNWITGYRLPTDCNVKLITLMEQGNDLASVEDAK